MHRRLYCGRHNRMLKFAAAATLMSASAATWSEEGPVLQEITVTGKQSDIKERRESNQQKVVLLREEIESLGAMTIGEVLGKLPGIELPGGEGSQRARGMSRDSVQILLDGERSAGGSHVIAGTVSRLPVEELERVEILRGASAEFGGAASVTVNLIMKKPKSKRSTAIKAGIGARGNEPMAKFNWTENGGNGALNWTYPITLNLSRTPTQLDTNRQDFSAGTRSAWNTESENGLYTFREFVMSPRVSWKKGSDSLSVAPTFFDGSGKRNSDMTQSAYADPAQGSGLAFSGDRNSHEDNHRRMLRLRVEGEKHAGENKFTGRAAINDGTRTVDVTRISRDELLNVSPPATEHSTSREHEFNAALRLDRPMFDDHLLAAGGELINFRSTVEQAYAGGYGTTASYNAKERQGIAWLQDDWTIGPKLTFTYGLRGEAVVLESGAVSQRHGLLMPSVAVRWEAAEKWLVRSSLGTGMKMPTLAEISDSGTTSVAVNTPVEADARGNPDLMPERSLNLEVVLERYLDDGAGLLGANVYLRHTQNFTERRVQLEGVRWVDRPQNEGDALMWGLELDGKLKTDSLGWEGATLKAHLTLPHAEVKDVRMGITRMARDTPIYTFSTGLDQSLPKLDSSCGVSLQVSGRSATDIPGEHVAFTRAKSTLDAFWLYKLTPKFNLRSNITNLLANQTEKQTNYSAAGNLWSLGTTESGSRTLMITLEGRL